MSPTGCRRSSTTWCLGVLAVLAALLVAGCADVNVEPFAPSPIVPGSGAGIRTLHITGTLTAEQGGCLEARVLYDGQPLPNATAACGDEAGCIRLSLAAETTTGTGRHTVSLQVLRQSLDETVYLAEVSIRMSREGLTFVLPISPESVRRTLRAGETVSFPLQLTDWPGSESVR